MTLWPQEQSPFPRRHIITTFYAGDLPVNINDATLTQTTNWGTANRAVFMPIIVREPAAVQKVGWSNGNSLSGNIDVGVYTPKGGRIFSTGSTAMAGTNQWQFVDVTDFLLSPGDYYLAVSLDTSASRIAHLGVNGSTTNTYYAEIAGAAMQDSSFPLPDLATLTTILTTRWPLLALSLGRY